MDDQQKPVDPAKPKARRKRAKAQGKPKGKNGRPAAFDEKKLSQLKAFMRLKPTLKDTAAFFEVDPKTVEVTVKRHWGIGFTEFRDQNMVHTRMNLIRRAIEKADRGDNVMLIFCLKNLCEWKDRYDTNVKGDVGAGSTAPQVIVNLPSNGREVTSTAAGPTPLRPVAKA